MAIQSQFRMAINQIASEKNISTEAVIRAICESIEYSYEELQGYDGNIQVSWNEETESLQAIATKTVVMSVVNEALEVPLIQAITIQKGVKIGDIIEIDVSKEGDFGRVAAQAVRNVLSNKVRDIEKDTLIDKFEKFVGTVQTGLIQKIDKKKINIEIDRMIVSMDREEAIKTENYRVGQKIQVLIKEITEGTYRNVKVSRADPDFLKALFMSEIPEIESGSVVIKAIAREAGKRSKIAVYSNVSSIDPVGACVGQKGSRINSIMGQAGEKVDIILWDADPATFAANALSPAQTIRQYYFDDGITWEEAEEVLEETREKYANIPEGHKLTAQEEKEFELLQKLPANGYLLQSFITLRGEDSDSVYAIEPNTVKIMVPDLQLSLAIGQKGENARLASKLTRFNIEVEGPTTKVGQEIQDQIDGSVDNLTPITEQNEETSAVSDSQTENVEISTEA